MELLKKLTQAISPSGCEGEIVKIIEDEVKKYADEVYTDSLGSLVVHIKGSGKRAMVCAHADEIGVLKLDMSPRKELSAGNVGYIISGIKKLIGIFEIV